MFLPLRMMGVTHQTPTPRNPTLHPEVSEYMATVKAEIKNGIMSNNSPVVSKIGKLHPDINEYMATAKADVKSGITSKNSPVVSKIKIKTSVSPMLAN